MKKVCVWLAIISAIVLFVTMGIVGVKILDNNYDFMVEIYIAIPFYIILFGSIAGYKLIGIRCPHCGKIDDTLLGKSKFCPHCGKEL